MAVTPDEYEIPLYIAESVKEIRENYNVADSTVRSAISRGHNGVRTGRKYVKVEIEEE